MGVEKCDIFYDNPACTYYEGQVVNGHVEFTLNSTKKFRGIKIEFIGESDVFWQESQQRKDANGRNETYHEHYKAHEEYFRIKYYLMGSGSGSDHELPAGKHAFPFTCALPPGIPTSFEGEHGYVRYTIKVTIDRPWKFDNEYKFAFTVLSVYDLNANLRLKEEVNDHISKTFCCCCCKSGPFNMNVNMPCTGFVPGQTVPINIDCDNASSEKIKYVEITLVKVTKYFAHTPHGKTKSTSEDVVTITTDGLEVGEEATFCEQMLIPPLPPSDLTNCSLIDIDYKITVKAKVGGCSESPYTVLFVQIGTIPIHDKVDELVPTDEVSEPESGDEGTKALEPLNPPQPGVVGWNNQQQSYPPNPPNNYQPVTTYPPSEGNPYPGNVNPYQPTTTPYPSNGGNPQFPGTPNPYQPTTSPYPGTPNPYQPTTAPYPTSNETSYPPVTPTQYPNVQGSPYPANTPYPPQQQFVQPTQGAPYPPAGGAPYPPAAGSSYPPATGAPYPPSSNAPYPLVAGPAPVMNLPSHIAPPTYAESQYKPSTIQSQSDSEHVNVGTQNYAPRYPVYNFPPPTAPPPQ